MKKVALALVAVLLPVMAFAQSVTVLNASQKVLPGDGPAADQVAEIHAARNEFEAFQVVIRGPVTSVTVSPPVLIGPGGADIPATEIRLFREEYVNITTRSNVEGGTGRWPDPLIPDVDETANEKRNAFPFDVPAGENRVVFVDIHVPQGQAAGTYQGSLAVTGTGLGTVNVPVTLLVWNFELPSTSSLASTFGMGWNSACIAHFGSYEACGYDAGVERMHLLYGRFLLDHRVTADVVYTGATNCSGTSCDWSHFDATYGSFFDGTDGALRLHGALPTSIRYIWTLSSNAYVAWAQHFRTKGWFDRTYHYTCDEPTSGCAWSDINARAAMVHGADPDFRTLVTTNIFDANANGVTSSVNILSPLVNQMDDKAGTGQFSGNQRPQYDAFLQSNPRNMLWWYQSCASHGCYIDGGDYFTNWPSLVIDDSAVQNRAQGMMSWLYHVGGVLYFSLDTHLNTAWTGSYDYGGNGDGTLLYPGKPSIIGGQTDIPVASLRLKMIREGFEDYEYMKLVSDLGDPAFAQQVGQNLFPDVFAARQPPSAVYAAREALAQRILELNGSPGRITLTAPLSLTPSSPVVSQQLTASFTVTNTGGQAINVPYFLVGGRDSANTHVDFAPSQPITLQPGQQFTYQASQSFSTAGWYSAWPAYYDGANWQELATQTTFTVSAGSGPSRIEQDSAAITYGPNQWSWNTGTDNRASGGSYTTSSGGNSTLRLPFTGTGISVIGITDGCSGQATVDIDGTAQTIDNYRASGGGWQQVIFSKTGLANASHTLTLTVLGTKQAASCGTWVYVDAFDVTP